MVVGYQGGHEESWVGHISYRPTLMVIRGLLPALAPPTITPLEAELYELANLYAAVTSSSSPCDPVWGSNLYAALIKGHLLQ